MIPPPRSLILVGLVPWALVAACAALLVVLFVTTPGASASPCVCAEAP